jgi:hypothetical protein
MSHATQFVTSRDESNASCEDDISAPMINNNTIKQVRPSSTGTPIHLAEYLKSSRRERGNR